MYQLIKNAINDLRRQPVIGTVSVCGTALAIYLIMMIVMLQSVKVDSFAPESNRNRFLHITFNSFDFQDEGQSNGPMGFGFVRRYLYPMSTPEAVTAYAFTPEVSTVSVIGGGSFSADRLDTDGNFWKVFDFTFLDGKPYTQEDVESGAAFTSVVISRSLARRLFGEINVAGRQFMLNYKKVTVVGVVDDVSSLATKAYAQIWVPLIRTLSRAHDEWMGDLSVTILAKNQKDFPEIRKEYEQRMNSVAESGIVSIIPRNRPYDQWTETSEQIWANVEPDVESTKRKNFLIYAVLLLVPAINLSEMTRSRMRRRYAEIGVRRAFGATRASIVRSIIAENFVLTILAGFIGLALSIITAFLFGQTLFEIGSFRSISAPDVIVSPDVIFHWETFGWALLFCFLLNLLSSGLPAWNASRINIVNSLSGRLKS